MRFIHDDTIVALATAHGTSAIAIIRISGKNTFQICENIFRNKKGDAVKIADLHSHTVHFGTIVEKDIILDEVLLTVFKNPHSYTGEDCVEISCHGSVFIQQQLLSLLVRHGARLAEAGEFTLRAFLHGKFDLSQAEAVADLIASQSSASHQVAMQHMRGGFSSKIKTLRENLVNFASLIELELDFSEEDVEFANREDLKKLLYTIQSLIQRLVDSFEVGNVIKNGIPVAIVGKPNSGKSTLLNSILEEERAIVSEIPGTTRDTIEDEITIDGILFRFIDTAGLRETNDIIESIGVTRAVEKMKQSSIVIYLFDVHELSSGELKIALSELKSHIHGAQLLVVGNKIDKENFSEIQKEFSGFEVLFISAKEKLYIDDLKMKLVALFDNRTVNVTETIVTNARHVEALRNAGAAIQRTIEGLDKHLSGDLLAQDIREGLHHLGIITGEISTDDLLENIFSKFCIGK
ncbi:MAG: tRNA uridine-5-carboxymethylaminomethyl(34) synthesis GTPase MnmE [Bacteroidetes bacterium]|nr:tRNA uridine-5-carboxymethylaminomethyl(34) synthesis GTPase MnmE [Bacteroidota bacterium]